MVRFISRVGTGRLRKAAGIGLILSVPIAVIAMTVWAATYYNQEQSHRECARLVAQYELLRRHWRALEADPEFRPVIDTILQDALPESAEAEWKVKVIRRPVSDSWELSQFERDAFRQLESGNGDAWISSTGEMARFVSAVRMKESCLACHRLLNKQSDKPLNVRDVIAFVSVWRGPTQKVK